jgi:SAM-dependent methyltransferase
MPAVDLKEWKVTDRKTLTRHPWERARSAVILDLIKNEVGDANQPLKILDFGCGDLSVARDLAEKLPGASFIGIDSGYKEPNLAREIQNLSSDVKIVGLFPDLTSAEQNSKTHVDVVLLLDVLEHCEDDKDVLKKVKASRFIGPNTFFIITLPSHQSLWSKHDIFLTHYRRYSLKQLRQLLESADLHAKKIGYFFASLLLIRYFQVVAERIFPNLLFPWSKVSSERRSKLIDTMIVRTLSLDYKIGGLLRKLFLPAQGLSCFAVARNERR